MAKKLLNPEQDFPITPEFFEVVMLALIGREEMYDHVTVIEHEPAFVGYAGDAPLFLVIIFCGFQHAFGKRVEHAVAGAVANDEVVGK